MTDKESYELALRAIRDPSSIQFISYGFAFGYPACCILEFIDTGSGFDPKERFIPGNHSGFVPCKAHKKLIMSGKVKITDLIDKDRRIVGPFINIQLPVIPKKFVVKSKRVS